MRLPKENIDIMKIIKKISESKLFRGFRNEKDKEYSKRMLTKIVNNSLFMMWASYVLAWFGKYEIAETLSKTIASSIIARAVGYFAKSTLENISKHTTAFGKNIDTIYQPYDKYDNNHRDC